MHLRRHEDEHIEMRSGDPLATRVWEAGLPHRKASDPLIRAPHASELVAPGTTEPPDHRDAA